MSFQERYQKKSIQEEFYEEPFVIVGKEIYLKIKLLPTQTRIELIDYYDVDDVGCTGMYSRMLMVK